MSTGTPWRTSFGRSVKDLLDAPFRRDESEEAPVRSVAQLMTADADRGADLQHVLRPPASLELNDAGPFERPHGRFTLRVLHLDVHPGVRIQPVDFLDDALQVRVRRHVVVAVRVVGAHGQRRGRRQQECRDGQRSLSTGTPWRRSLWSTGTPWRRFLWCTGAPWRRSLRLSTHCAGTPRP